MTTEIAIIIDIVMMGIFLIIGLLFAVLKEKACVLISGYNFKSKAERKNYDELLMSKDMRNFWLICSGIFFVGAITTLLLGMSFFWISIFVWLIYFLKNVHLDEEKAFSKYKKHMNE
ncbi:DUF3784 domain-containing protein [Clostridium sp. Marseille-P299]|uniref:DUF3784 domain-containing protein n=1 Tax=Clostridium sp. Marseille-P299 TaxID=1805477 RepID=UPI000A6590ED|nr:DUF3784 domain-containing protein [Clostridium sp. Marseille-P299]